MLFTPTNCPPWQEAQPVVMPVWFIVHVAKPPGVVLLVWQLSHAMLVVMCTVGLLTTPAYWPLWQVAQPLLMPVWFIVHVAKLAVLVWQFSHAAVVTMWVAGLLTTPVNCPPWQLAQAVVMPAWFIVQLAKPPGVTVLVWQALHAAVVAICAAGLLTTLAYCPP